MTETIFIKDLTLDPKNARKHSKKNLDAIKGSLKKFGQQKPIVVSQDGIVIAGNGTVEAAKALGWDKIEITRSKLTGSDITAYAIADNRTGELAEWDLNILPGALEALSQDFDLGEIGFDKNDLAKFIKEEIKPGLTGDDEIPEQVETRCTPGDLWILGEHRLLCGDSTDVLQVERLMGGAKADMVFTDPPYNLQERGQTKRTNKTKTKRQDFGDWDIGFDPLDILPFLLTYTKDKAHLFVCTSSYLFGIIHDFFEENSVKPNYLVWCKNNPMPSMSKNRYVQATELIVHAIKGSPIFQYPSGENLKNWFISNVEAHDTGHPAQKPISMIEYFIKYTTGSVLDFFLGSGSTLIACEKTGRKCYGMELDPKYCDVIITRWEKFTGKEAQISKENSHGMG